MKKIIKLTESDLTRIVKKVIKEQSSFLKDIRDFIRGLYDEGEIDYNYIENNMSNKELADLIYAGLQNNAESDGDVPSDYKGYGFGTWGDAEAVVEAAFINMSKPNNLGSIPGNCVKCWENFSEVSSIYKNRFQGRDMWKDITDDISIDRKYHKKPIRQIIKSWGEIPMKSYK